MSEPLPVHSGAMPLNEASPTVELYEHTKGCLMRIEHDGACMLLDRNQAFELHEKIGAKLGSMPFRL